VTPFANSTGQRTANPHPASRAALGLPGYRYAFFAILKDIDARRITPTSRLTLAPAT
jgi:hypothetical protein